MRQSPLKAGLAVSQEPPLERINSLASAVAARTVRRGANALHPRIHTRLSLCPQVSSKSLVYGAVERIMARCEAARRLKTKNPLQGGFDGATGIARFRSFCPPVAQIREKKALQKTLKSLNGLTLVAGVGFEPTTFGL
jgi:hypothetical protein